MRDTGPVTDRERLMAADQFLVSRTDVRGIILFANQDFIDISGFSRDELIGKPHNLVRHPDMPAEAFADLWDTVRRGQSWIGVVKNRAKDGSCYWVRATVSPLTEDGRTIGFISVRVKPTSAEITAATRAYAEIRAGSRGWSVNRGRLTRTGPATCIRRALAPMSRRIALVVLAMLAIMSTGTAIGLSGLARSNQALADLVGDELGTAVAMQQLGMTCHDAWQHLVLASRPDSDIPAEIAKVKADLARSRA
jgi:methyl-accepting chemotaxis protein/aerotaxis receptor